MVRILHWQLEPGYREGMNTIIDAYNNLPMSKKTRWEVRQMAVTERVYASFSTFTSLAAPLRIFAKKAMSSLLGSGAQLARFFEPISGFVQDPNPYNQDAYLPGTMDEDLKQALDPKGDRLPDRIDPSWRTT